MLSTMQGWIISFEIFFVLSLLFFLLAYLLIPALRRAHAGLKDYLQKRFLSNLYYLVFVIVFLMLLKVFHNWCLFDYSLYNKLKGLHTILTFGGTPVWIYDLAARYKPYSGSFG